MQFNTLFKVVFHELCRSTFYFKFPEFTRELENKIKDSKQKCVEFAKNSFYSADSIAFKLLFDDYVAFTKSIPPCDFARLDQVNYDFSLLYYASAVLIKEYLLEWVKECAECGEGVDNEVKLDIVLYLSQSFVKYISPCKCAENCPQYFLNTVIRGDGKIWVDNCCKHNYMSMFSNTNAIYMLENTVEIIERNLRSIKNAGRHSEPVTSTNM